MPTHPYPTQVVAMCAVIGVPHATWGERLHAASV